MKSIYEDEANLFTTASELGESYSLVTSSYPLSPPISDLACDLTTQDQSAPTPPPTDEGQNQSREPETEARETEDPSKEPEAEAEEPLKEPIWTLGFHLCDLRY